MGKRIVVSLLIILTVLGCGAPVIDVGSLAVLPEDREKITLPKEVYQGKNWNVGVVEFENRTGIGPVHSTFGGHQKKSSYVKGAAVGVGVVPGGVGAVGVAAGTSSETGTFNVNQADIIPQIGGVAVQAAEEILLSMGGIKVYSRDSLEKVFNEQKFQASGMVDETSMVKLGKLIGLTHIVTGSVNNVKYDYGAALGSTITGTISGGGVAARWRIDVDTTIKVISVETGKVEFSKSFTAVSTANGTRAENRPDFFLGLAQEALKEALMRSKYDLAKFFPLRAYIQQMKGGKQAVLLNVGTAQGIEPGDKFQAYMFDAIEDPVTGQKTMSKYKIADLEVSQQVTENSCWAKPEEKGAKSLKLGMLVEKVAVKGAGQKWKEGTEFLK